LVETRPAASHSLARSRKFRPLFNPLAVALLAIFALSRWTILARHQPEHEASVFPQSAIAFLRTTHQPPRLFIYYDWGGYAIWKLNPQYQVFADGRADLYGDDLLTQCIQTVIQLRQGWHAVLDDWNVQTVLVPPTSALAQALLLDPHWTTPYHDARSIIFIRKQ